MYPNACLREILDALANGLRDTAKYRMEDMVDWLEHGQSKMPEVTIGPGEGVYTVGSSEHDIQDVR